MYEKYYFLLANSRTENKQINIEYLHHGCIIVCLPWKKSCCCEHIQRTADPVFNYWMETWESIENRYYEIGEMYDFFSSQKWVKNMKKMATKWRKLLVLTDIEQKKRNVNAGYRLNGVFYGKYLKWMKILRKYKNKQQLNGEDNINRGFKRQISKE